MNQVLKNGAYIPIREMMLKIKKENLNPKDLVNDEESKRIYHRHIIKSIKTTKKTVMEEDVVKYQNWFKQQGSV